LRNEGKLIKKLKLFSPECDSARHSIHTTTWNTCCPNNAKLLMMYFTDNSAKV
jgi:hypothetical protein